MIKNGEFVKLWVKISNSHVYDERERIIPIGNGFLPKKVEETIKQHKIGDEYEITLKPEDAYGKRTHELIKMIPMKYFIRENINPTRGMLVNVDGILGKVISVGSGRVMVDFNHPLAGKELKFSIKLIEKIEDKAIQTKALLKEWLNQDFEVKEENGEITIKGNVAEELKENILSELKKIINTKSIKFIS